MNFPIKKSSWKTFVIFLISLAIAVGGLSPARAVVFASPFLASITPSSGPDIGGNTIRLIGSDWDTVNGLTVNFAGIADVAVPAAAVYQDVSSTNNYVDVAVPPHLSGGPVQVKVVNFGGAQTATAPYTYYASFPNFSQDKTVGGSAAVDINLSPATGCLSASPCGFTPSSTVSATVGGNVLATSFTTSTDGGGNVTGITVHMPIHHPAFATRGTPDVATIVVDNHNGNTASGTYTYYEDPSIAFSPSTVAAPVNSPLTTIQLSHPGGPCTSWSTSGNLPTGLVWNSVTETISGTALVAAAPSVFTVTCTNSVIGASSQASLTLSSAKLVQSVTSFSLTGASGSAPSYSINYGATAPTISVTSNHGNPYVVTSNDPAVTVVNNVISINGATTGATLTAHLPETLTYGASDPGTDPTITLVVNKSNQSISQFTLTGATGTAPSYSATFGTTGITYLVRALPLTGGGNVSVTSNDACVTIGANSSVTLSCVPNAGAGGTATLTASVTGNSNYNGPITQDVSLAVTKGTLGVNFTPATMMVVGGASQDLAIHATLTPVGIGAPYVITYAVDPASSAVCSLQGHIVTALAVGTCIVSASAAGDNNMNASLVVVKNITIVARSTQILTYSGIAAAYKYGDADVSFSVTDLFGNPLTVTAGSSTVGTISGSGNSFVLHITGAGTLQITASDPLTQTTKTFSVAISPKTVTIGDFFASVSAAGEVTFDPAPVIGAVNGDAVHVDASQVLASYGANGLLSWTGNFLLAGFNAPNYVLSAQPISIPVYAAVFSVSPNVGSLVGGNKVAIRGVGFTSATSISFGGMLAASSQFVNPGLIYAITPVHNAGLVPLVVSSPGHGPLTLQNGFEFKSLPATILSVTPTASSVLGGGTFKIVGENFTPELTVTLDGIGIQVVGLTPNEILVVVPPHAAGKVTLVVTNPGLAPTQWASDFVYSYPVTVDPFSPIRAWNSGGLKVTLTGNRFSTGDQVHVGVALADSIVVLDAKTISFVIPVTAMTGAVDLVVTGTDGVTATIPGAVVLYNSPGLTIRYSGTAQAVAKKYESLVAKFVGQVKKSSIKVTALSIHAFTKGPNPSRAEKALALARAKVLKAALMKAGLKLKFALSVSSGSGKLSNVASIGAQ